MKKILAMLLALMLVLSMLTVSVFAEIGNNGEDVEGDGDTTTVTDNEPATKPEKNPTTGVALAVVPMMVAAAAAVVAKKH